MDYTRSDMKYKSRIAATASRQSGPHRPRLAVSAMVILASVVGIILTKYMAVSDLGDHYFGDDSYFDWWIVSI
jgi:hypothetical protein